MSFRLFLLSTSVARERTEIVSKKRVAPRASRIVNQIVATELAEHRKGHWTFTDNSAHGKTTLHSNHRDLGTGN